MTPFLESGDTDVLLDRGFTRSSFNMCIFYGKDRDGMTWQVEDRGKKLIFRALTTGVSCRMSMPEFNILFNKGATA